MVKENYVLENGTMRQIAKGLRKDFAYRSVCGQYSGHVQQLHRVLGYDGSVLENVRKLLLERETRNSCIEVSTIYKPDLFNWEFELYCGMSFFLNSAQQIVLLERANTK